jgi:serine/threonine protein kinase
VILKQMVSIPNSSKLSPEDLEKKYVHMVEVKPAFQEYLKIGPSFAFFMDLAKYFFLSATIDEIHSDSLRLLDEAMQHPELLWDHNGFVCRYGEEAGSVCHDLQKIYHSCEKQLRLIIDETGAGNDIPNFHFKQWFLMHLVGEQILPANEQLPEEVVEKVNQLLQKTVESKAPEVEKYRRNLKKYIFETKFSQHRNQLECLASNTLDLLAWIGAKSMALRDLKPENLFVAGNPDEYPVFLNNTRNFTIGLIDVETAVAIDAKDPADIPQPQLAGTPLYATPSHLISNSLLMEVYDDLAAVMHTQDWYAAIGIIFKIFTGENLFPSTARVFPEILKNLKHVNPAGPDLEGDIARINRLFWNSAEAELQEALFTHRNVLRRVEVTIPADFVKYIIKALHSDTYKINQTIVQSVNDQPFFTSVEKKQYLVDASVFKIHSMKTKLSQEKHASKDMAEHHDQIQAFFDRLASLKDHLQRKLEAAANLKATGAPITADQLLEAMFHHVFNTHYLEHWPPLKPSKWSGKAKVPDDITTYQAII